MGQMLELAGEAKVKVKVKRMKKMVKISLFGQDWINTFFGKDGKHKCNCQKGMPTKLQKLLDKYTKTVFKPDLGKLEDITAKLTLQPESIPTLRVG